MFKNIHLLNFYRFIFKIFKQIDIFGRFYHNFIFSKFYINGQFNINKDIAKIKKERIRLICVKNI